MLKFTVTILAFGPFPNNVQHMGAGVRRISVTIGTLASPNSFLMTPHAATCSVGGPIIGAVVVSSTSRKGGFRIPKIKRTDCGNIRVRVLAVALVA